MKLLQKIKRNLGLLSLVASFACSKLSFQPDPRARSVVKGISFSGFSEAFIDETGRLTFRWNTPDDLPAAEEFIYEIYWSSTSKGLADVLASTHLAEAEGSLESLQIVEMTSEEQPSESGKLVATLAQKQTSYIVQEHMDIGQSYLFQLVVTTAKGLRIPSRKVVVYEHGLRNLEPFIGIEGVSSPVHGVVELGWSLAGVEGVSAYRIYEGTDFKTLLTSVGPSTSSYRIANLAPGSDLAFGVRAVDQFGYEDVNTRSLHITVFNSQSGDLTPPIFRGFVGAGAQTLSSSEDKLRISFKRSLEEDVTSYSIRVRKNGSTAPFTEKALINQVTSGDITTDIAGLNGATVYDIQVKVIDTSGNESVAENFVSATTADLTPPVFAGVSSIQRDIVANPWAVVVGWRLPSSLDAAQYRIYYSKQTIQAESFSRNDSFPKLVNGKTIYSKLVNVGSVMAETLTINSELDANSIYYFVVRASDGAGNEDMNTVQESYVVPAVTIPNFAGLTSASSVANTRHVALAWTGPGSAPLASHYLVSVSSSASTPRNWSAPITVAAPASSYMVVADPADNQALRELVTYYFKVNARSSEGFTDNNSVEQAVSIPDITPPTFAGIRNIGVDGLNEALVLEFSGASDIQGIREYYVYWKSLPGGSYQALGSPAKTVGQAVACASNPCRINMTQADGLTVGQNYEFRIDAADNNNPVNIAVSLESRQAMLPDFTLPAAPLAAAKSPEPSAPTNERSYVVSGVGINNMIVRVYCENLTTATTLALSTCGGSSALSGTTSYSIPVVLPESEANYQLKVVHYNPTNAQESSGINAGNPVSLDLTVASLAAFAGCASGLCFDYPAIGGASATINQAILSFKTDESGSYTIKDGSTLVTSGTMTANQRVDIVFAASDLAGVEGAHNLRLYLTDSAGNISPAETIGLTLDLSPPALQAASLKVIKTQLSDTYIVRWSAVGVASSDTYTLTQVAGSTPATTISALEIKASSLAGASESTTVAGANSQALPQSFSLFACDTLGNCARASAVLDASFSDLRNDATGSTAKFIWSVATGGTARLAYGVSRRSIEDWDGFSLPGGLNFVNPGETDCTSPSTVGCSVDFSALLPWQKRYLRIALPSTDGKGVSLSSTYIFGRVPEGMVYVDKDAWPNEEGFSYKNWEKFSFAVDKYEVQLVSGTLSGNSTISAGGDGILDSLPTGLPSNNANMYTFKRGCLNRSANWPTYVGTTEARRIRLLTGLEFVAAAYGTPEVGGQGYCNIDSRGTPAAPDENGNNDNAKCVSYFGARNLLGNLLEYTDEILRSRQFIRFYGVGDSREVETLPVPISSETSGVVAVQDFDPVTAFAVLGTRVGPWSSLTPKHSQDWGAASARPTGSNARAMIRGGAFASSVLASRFTTHITNTPGSTYGSVGGRCALAAPEPGFVRFRNDSEGNKARLSWRLWGDHATVRIAFAKEGSPTARQVIEAWDGSNSGTGISDNLYTVSQYDACSESSYNSTGFEVLGTGSTTSGSFGLQGRCGVDLASLSPWEKRYVRLYASNAYGETFSDIFVIARVPAGMVFVAADDWPNPQTHRAAAEIGESYNSPYSFAIDKYEVTANGSVPNCTSEDFPCTTSGFTGSLVSNGSTPAANLNWYSYKQGCDNRTAILGPTWADTTASVGDPAGRRVHLPTGIEWIVASFDTPDAMGPMFCNISNGFWTVGNPANQSMTGTSSMEFCRSRYGVRNMLGNQVEWTDEMIDSGIMYRHWTISGGTDTGLVGTWDVADGFITAWDFSQVVPNASTLTQSAGSFGDAYLFKTAGALSTYGTKAIALLRGGSLNAGSLAGRFLLFFNQAPTASASNYGGRCALVAP